MKLPMELSPLVVCPVELKYEKPAEVEEPPSRVSTEVRNKKSAELNSCAEETKIKSPSVLKRRSAAMVSRFIRITAFPPWPLLWSHR
jgi:hypothetical protein